MHTKVNRRRCRSTDNGSPKFAEDIALAAKAEPALTGNGLLKSDAKDLWTRVERFVHKFGSQEKKIPNVPPTISNAEHSAELKKLTETLLQRMIQKEQEFLKAHTGLVRTIECAREELALRIARLEVQYGKETVQEALSLFNTSEAKLVKNIRTCEVLEETAQKLQKINGNQRWERFKYDAAHNDSVALKNIDEAMAGVACEEQKILGKLARSSHRGEEFIENSMQCWDVKTAPKYSLEGKDIFNPESFVESIKGGINSKENIIVNVTNLQKNDIKGLYEVMNRQLNIDELKKLVVIHVTDSAQSKASLELIKYLGKI